MKSAIRAFLLLALFWALSGNAGYAFLTDGGTYAVDTSLSPPAAGLSYTDPVFGTTITRVSDARSMTDNASGGRLEFIITEYATMSAFNSDNSRFILQHESYYGLYDGSGAYLRDLPFAISASTEPRWSRSSPSLLYYVSGNELRSYDVSSGATRVVRAFSQYGSISGRGESDIGFTDDRFVLVGDGQYVFVYDVSADAMSSTLYTAGHAFDAVYLTPDDNVIISWLDYGTGPYQGVELFDGQMVFQRNLTPVVGHMDVTRDSDGEEVLIWTNSADRNPLPGCDNGVVKVRLADAAQACLLSLDWSLAKHIAAPDGNGWVYVSTYAPADPDPAGPDWHPYTNELLRVRLDGGEVRRLAHHRSRPFNSYNYEPRPMISRDGSRLLYSSNFGLQDTGGDYGTEYSDVYLIDVDGTTPGGGDGGGGGNSGPTLLEETDAAVRYVGAWTSASGPAYSGGTATRSRDRGALAIVEFDGTGIRWIGYEDGSSGQAFVSLDGHRVAKVDTAASPTQAQAVVYSITDLTPGTHTLEIEVLGRYHRRNSDDSWVWVDAFEVTH